jgi:hypothetical protein
MPFVFLVITIIMELYVDEDIEEIRQHTGSMGQQSVGHHCTPRLPLYTTYYPTSPLSNFLQYWTSFCVLYSALLHLPPLKFHCVGGC